MKKMPPTSPDAPSETATDAVGTLAVLGPVARSTVVDAVADRLRGEILAGRLAAGSRLPSERELSLALGVNRLTLRAALARLEAMGLVTTRHGSGTEVSSWRERAGLETLGMVMSSLDPHEPAWLELFTSLLEIRRILAAEAVALACLRHTESDLAALREIAAQQATRVHDPVAYSRGDITFQRAVARAAGNVGVELILNSFARFPEEQPALVAQLYDRREDSLGFYDAVIELIRAGDSSSARALVTAALGAIDDAWFHRHGYQAPDRSKKPAFATAPAAGAASPTTKKDLRRDSAGTSSAQRPSKKGTKGR